MRLIRITGWSLLAITVSLIGAAVLVLGTETGLRWSLEQLETATGGDLKINLARGRLAGDIRLQGVRFRNKNSSISAEELTLQWRPESLLQGRLRIVALDAKQLHVTQLGQNEQQQPFQGFSLPLPIELERATVSGFQFSKSDAAPVKLNQISFSGNYYNTTLTLRKLTVAAPQGEVQAQGKIETTAELNFNLDAKWQWNAPPSSIISGSGTLHLTGTPKQYRFDAEADLPSEKLSPVQLNINGTGDLSGLQAEKLRANWLEGEWTGSGHLQWKPALSWNAELSGKTINPALAWEKWPGGKISLQLTGQGDSGKTEVELKKLDGMVQKYPVAASGKFGFSNGILRVKNARLNSGTARLTASGSVGKKWQAKWHLKAPELAHLWPDLEGKLDASGSVAGPRKQPHLRVQLEGDNVRWKQYLAERLQGDLNFGLQENDPWLIKAEINKIHIGKNRLNHFSLTGEGTTLAHRFRLQLDRDKTTRLRSDIRGSLQKGIWHAVLENGQISIPEQQWQQQQNAELQLGKSVASLSSWCWQHKTSRLCIDGKKAADGGWLADLSLQKFGLKWLQPWLPKTGVTLTGLAAGTAHLVYREGQIDGSNLTLRMYDGTVQYITPDKERYDTTYRELKLQINKNPQGVEGSLNADLLKTGSAQGSLKLPGWQLSAPLAATQPLSGELKVTLNELTLLPLFAPKIHQPTGKIAGDLALAGTFGEPQLNGVIKLDNGAFSLPDLGLKLHEINLQAKTRQNSELVLQGSARSGPGTLAISGEIGFNSLREWKTKIKLKGKDVQVARIPEAKVIASPDLAIYIQPRKIQISGYIEIPKAKIKLPEKQGLVQVSPDVVVIGGDETEVLQQKRWTIATTIALKLGKKVKVRGHGFEGRITGQLAIIESPNRPAIAQGELEIHDGSYKIYGQKINIDEGRLLYAASPLNNPGLQFRIIRRSRDVEAGMNVFGRLKKPELQLFSSPPMDDGDILAYLLIGKPLREASTSEGTRLSQAASSLQLAGGAWLAKRLGKQLDIEDVSIESGATDDNTSLVLGKYLSPRLYVQYVIGLTEGGNILRARYEINKHWLLESESGYQSGIDLLFTMER